MFKYSLNGREMSLDELIGAVKKYGEELPEKVNKIGDLAADELKNLAATGFNGAGYDDRVHGGMSEADVSVERTPTEGNLRSVIAHGKQAAFVEFGAGVRHNGPAGTSPNPYGQEHGIFIGEYGEGNGKRRVWGFYDPPDKRDKDHLVLTYGTPASMPLYHATQEVKQRIPEIARDVFKGGEQG